MPLPSYATKPFDQPFVFIPTGIGFLQRPWICVEKDSHPEALLVLEKCTSKVLANLGLLVRSTKRFVVFLDTVADYRFIRLSEIVQDMQQNIRKIDSAPNIHKANGDDVPIVGTIDLMVQIGTITEFVTFLVTKQLETSVILGCDFGHRHVEAIMARLAIFKMDNGSTVTILRMPSKDNTDVLLPAEQQFSNRKTVLHPRAKRRNEFL